jgi:hypothetical protein
VWKLIAYCAHYGSQQVPHLLAMPLRSLNLFSRALSEILGERNAAGGGSDE